MNTTSDHNFTMEHKDFAMIDDEQFPQERNDALRLGRNLAAHIEYCENRFDVLHK